MGREQKLDYIATRLLAENRGRPKPVPDVEIPSEELDQLLSTSTSESPSGPTEMAMSAEEADAQVYGYLDEIDRAGDSGSEQSERRTPRESPGGPQDPTPEELDELLA